MSMESNRHLFNSVVRDREVELAFLNYQNVSCKLEFQIQLEF